MYVQPAKPFWMGEFPNTTLEVIRGDAMAYYVELFCDCPVPVDITGWQFMFKVKESLDPDDPNVLLAVLWTELNGACGITALIVIPALTANLVDGSYAFDFKYRTPSNLVKTIERGVLDVLPTSDLELSFDQQVPPATSLGMTTQVDPSVLAGANTLALRQMKEALRGSGTSYSSTNPQRLGYG